MPTQAALAVTLPLEKLIVVYHRRTTGPWWCGVAGDRCIDAPRERQTQLSTADL